MNATETYYIEILFGPAQMFSTYIAAPTIERETDKPIPMVPHIYGDVSSRNLLITENIYPLFIEKCEKLTIQN